METARDSQTFDLVEAEELWSLPFVDASRYICRGCTQQVFPASYDKEINKKRPYFRLGALKEHLTGCDIDGEDKVVKRAKKERVGTPEGYPMPFPNRLVLAEYRPIERGEEGNSLADGRARTSGDQERVDATERKHHGHTVTTIRMICRTYMRYPNDRPSMPLHVPGVPGNTYLQVFRSVAGKPELLANPTRLFYGPIRWKESPLIREEYCELTLSAGEWDETQKAYKRMYRVRVYWTSWSKVRQNTLIREYETTREEAEEQFRSEKSAQGWLFFVGTQDKADPSIFNVANHRLICSISGVVERPVNK